MTSAYRTAKWALIVPGWISPALRWPDKLPLDTLDYTLDLSAWLVDESDTIASVVAFERNNGLSVTNAVASASLIVMWISGGIYSPTPYFIDVVVTTTGGRVEDFAISILVADGPASSASTDVLTFSGVPVTFGATS